jgi:hypothetical protein
LIQIKVAIAISGLNQAQVPDKEAAMRALDLVWNGFRSMQEPRLPEIAPSPPERAPARPEEAPSMPEVQPARPEELPYVPEPAPERPNEVPLTE